MNDLRVLVSGSAGQIAYSLLFSLAKGDVFGTNQKIHLILFDIPQMISSVQGVCMELFDCSFPNLLNVTATSNITEAFTDIDFAILIGAMPRKEGMERKDLLKANVRIFQDQGRALNCFAKKTVKVLVVGNPANTNCLVASLSAPTIPKKNFSCLTRLDQNRAQAQIANKLGINSSDVNNIIIWGNHSSTQFPDVNHAACIINNKQSSVVDAVTDSDWLKSKFVSIVQSRGSAVIKARKLSSAMSAAKSICDHLSDWYSGRSDDQWTSMGVYSNGEYGVPIGIIYSFPVLIKNDGSYEIVEGLKINSEARERMKITADELIEERKLAFQFLSINQLEKSHL